MSTPSSALRDRLFPSQTVDGNTLRIELVASWEAQFIGLGRLTKFLTEQMPKRNYGVDDMGVYVVFLQRHRVEVGLKLILERVKDPVMRPTHKLDVLLDSCKGKARVTHASAYDRFDARQREFIELMHQVDPGAASYRYPVDTASALWQREALVDLDELEAAGASFEADVLALVKALGSLEPLPVDAIDAAHAAQQLAALADSAQGWMSAHDKTTAMIKAEGARLQAIVERLGAKPRQPRDEDNAADAGLKSLMEVSTAVAQRVEHMLDRIVGEHTGVEPHRTSPVDPPPNPPMVVSPDPAVVAAQQEAQMKWFVDVFIETMRPFAEAVEQLAATTKTWTTPAARQVHLDVERLRSRIDAAWTAPRATT